MRQDSEDDQEYSQEEIKLMQLRERQSQHRKDLELLTSENCPKKHPFDFGPRELADIKKAELEFFLTVLCHGRELNPRHKVAPSLRIFLRKLYQLSYHDCSQKGDIIEAFEVKD